MTTRLTRRKLSEYYASQILAGRDASLELAAYLVQTRRTRELDMIVRDIETRLASKGLLVADVVSASQLSDVTAKQIKKFLGSQYKDAEIEIRQTTDPSVIGGVKITTPDSEFDGTIRRKLNNLRASKI